MLPWAIAILIRSSKIISPQAEYQTCLNIQHGTKLSVFHQNQQWFCDAVLCLSKHKELGFLRPVLLNYSCDVPLFRGLFRLIIFGKEFSFMCVCANM